MHANAVVKALIQAGIIDNVMEMAFKSPSEFEFECERNPLLEEKRTEAGARLKIAQVALKKAKAEAKAEAQAKLDAAQAEVDELEERTDATSDAKFLLEANRLANLALFGAILAEDNKEMPVNTAADDTLSHEESMEEAEDNPENCHKPSDSGREIIKPLSVAKAVEYHDMVWGRIVHTANIEGLSWLTGFDVRKKVKDADGADVRDEHGDKMTEMVKVTLCRPFGEWLRHELETTTSEDWEASLLVAKAKGWLEFKPSHVNVSKGREDFNAWLEEVPLNRKGLTSTRRERIVAAVGDRKWNAIVKSTLALVAAPNRGTKNAFNKACADIIIAGFSPIAVRQVATMKRSSVYRNLILQRDNEALQTEMEEAQLEADMVVQKTIRATIQIKQLETLELQAKLEAQMKEVSAMLTAKLDALKPKVEEPKVEEPKVEEPKKEAPKGVKLSVPLTQGMRPIGIR